MEPDADSAMRRRRYRRERDCIANAATAYVVSLLGSDDEVRRTAARDELLRREACEVGACEGGACEGGACEGGARRGDGPWMRR